MRSFDLIPIPPHPLQYWCWFRFVSDSDFACWSVSHTNSQCVQYHNCSYYSLAFDSCSCCCCCWWQMAFHYACGTCADFVITLNKSQILPCHGLTLSQTFAGVLEGSRKIAGLLSVSFNQSLLLLSSNWACDFNWKACTEVIVYCVKALTDAVTVPSVLSLSL